MPDGTSTVLRSLARALWAIVGERLYPYERQLKVYHVPSQLKANWALSSSLRGTMKNISFISRVAIQGWAAVCIVVPMEVMLGTAAVSARLLLFSFR